jgi:hypothetical protein
MWQIGGEFENLQGNIGENAYNWKVVEFLDNSVMNFLMLFCKLIRL